MWWRNTRPTAPFCVILGRRDLDKRRFANLLRRVPWTGRLVQTFIRPLQPWVTMGAVGAVFNDEGKLLIVEHVFHPRFPWGLPGGWMNRNEDPDETVHREVYEETGLRVEIVKPLILSRPRLMPRHIDVAYLCYAPPDAGAIRLSGELLDYRWIDPENVLETPPMADFHQLVISTALAGRSQDHMALQDLQDIR
jgi:8-oxo-dGTP diphosphatase